MASLRLVVGDELPWATPVAGYDVKRMHPGTDGHPELFELHLGPDFHQEQHAHAEDEIIYVTAGSLIFGSTVLGPHSSVMVPKHTLYQFRTGPDGATFLNFRPHRADVITKDEWATRRSTGFDD
jgi:hypothetical protein